MHDQLVPGTPVRTKKPATETDGWSPEDKVLRRWNLKGRVVDRSERHGFRPITTEARVCYQVEHEDKTTAWYERRELQRQDVQTYTPEERKEMIDKMRVVAGDFYNRAVFVGVHAFIEFAGLLNEFITVCDKAQGEDIDFTFANTHTGQALPFEAHNAAYLAEKLNCIYGPALLSDEENRHAFIETLFDGAYKLVPAPLQEGTKVRFAEEDEL